LFPDPFGDTAERGCTVTGDLVRYRADGMIEFLGRREFSSQAAGFRIELGEIERGWWSRPRVRESGGTGA